MNRDLKEFIDTFKTLDEQDLFDIGSVHKCLPRTERNWPELFDYLDIDDRFNSNSENYRKWVQKKERLGWVVRTSCPSILCDQDTIVEKSREAYKTKFLAQAQLNEYNKKLRETARIEEFEKIIADAVNNLNEITPVKFNAKIDKKSKAEAVLLLSDFHIGNECDNFYNKYNLDIAKQRLATVIDSTIKYCQINNVKKLNVLNLGDLIHGLIHVNARIMQQMDVADQVAAASELMAEALNELQKAAPKVTYRSCTDNHARMTPNKKEAIESENFYKLIDMIVKLRLGKSSIEFCDDNLNIDLGKFTLGNGKICMFSHGHHDKIDQVVQRFTGANNGVSPDFVFLGHTHEAKMKTFNSSKVIINGSLVGTEEYAYDNRLFGKPEQTLVIFDDKNIQNIVMRVE